MTYELYESGVIKNPNKIIIGNLGQTDEKGWIKGRGYVEIAHAEKEGKFYACVSMHCHERGRSQGLTFEDRDRYDSLDHFIDTVTPEVVKYLEEDERDSKLLKQFLEFVSANKQTTLF